MKGQILDFSIQANSGIISGENGIRYTFSGSGWKEQSAPNKGMIVDFDIDENDNAIGIYKAITNKVNSTQSINHIFEAKDSTTLSLFDYFVICIKNKFWNFSERASLREFWGFQLFHFLIGLGLIILSGIGASISEDMAVILSIPYYLFILGLLIPNIAVGIRRLHDIGKSGWWYLLILIPIVGSIALIIFWCQKSIPETNQWGDSSN